MRHVYYEICFISDNESFKKKLSTHVKTALALTSALPDRRGNLAFHAPQIARFNFMFLSCSIVSKEVLKENIKEKLFISPKKSGKNA